MTQYSLCSASVLSTDLFIKKTTLNFKTLYQKKTSGVKAAEEPEQNSTNTCLFATHASKGSSHHSSAQGAPYKSIQGPHGLAGQFALLPMDRQHPPVTARHASSLSPSTPHMVGQECSQVGELVSIPLCFGTRTKKDV